MDSLTSSYLDLDKAILEYTINFYDFDEFIDQAETKCERDVKLRKDWNLKKIDESLRSKRNITVIDALTTTSVKSKAWPNKWKAYLLTWRRMEGSLNDSNIWSWNLNSISLAGCSGDEYTVKKSTIFLKDRYTHLTAAQKNVDPTLIDSQKE
ncbi:5610_t:CDS:2 [Cetraspora pellucida]|uniref:5610_t:CDS:1 n=1 Tax=Cetraspora pellucida TaxID=1433469 RepID=A0A9N9CKJ4_9GLOM|nr:5610_t:CDS:2 [Cetraspora pellucida]